MQQYSKHDEKYGRTARDHFSLVHHLLEGTARAGIISLTRCFKHILETLAIATGGSYKVLQQCTGGTTVNFFGPNFNATYFNLFLFLSTANGTMCCLCFMHKFC